MTCYSVPTWSGSESLIIIEKTETKNVICQSELVEDWN